MSFEAFVRELAIHLPAQRIITDEFRRFALSTDASFYRLVPKAVVYVDDDTEVIKLFSLASRYQIGLTFRAAGTSLSGQAVTDQVLVVLTDQWASASVEPLGEVVHAQPGMTGAKLNQTLLPFGRKIGPDPASMNSCKIGGIVANNASGICCGHQQTSYHTLQHLRVILADGSLLDTKSTESIARFRRTHEALLSSLLELRHDLLANADLTAKVEQKYQLKNTTGYGLNALLDYEDPIDILIHLMVGSEGTLGFISEVSLATIEVLPNRATAMIVFDQLTHCVCLISELKKHAVDAVELLDARAIASLANQPGMPELAKQCPAQGGVLLIDVKAGSQAALDEAIEQVEALVSAVESAQSTGFTQDAELIESYWDIRKATFPVVGASRAVGTTVIIEDIALPLTNLASGIEALQELFDEFGYHDAIIFGHALAGNLHFVFSQSFKEPEDIARYQAFMAKLTQLVTLDFAGSLKAEHGTGRHTAPFVELEWGTQAYQLMIRIKQLFDPKGLLNPGVLINEDPLAHVTNLKQMPATDDLIDKCTECGFCERVCPSKDVSLTPRQRIAVLREMSRRQKERLPVSSRWHREFQRQAIDTCVATSLCEQACPVGVDTGAMVLKVRARQNHRYRKLAKYMARHFASLASWVRGALTVGQMLQWLFGAQRLEALTIFLRKLTKVTPVWLATTPRSNKPLYVRNERMEPTAKDAVVYWASCVSQSFAGSAMDDRQSIPQAVQSVLGKAGLSVVYPQPTRGLCCGQTFRSKGHHHTADQMMTELLDELWAVTSGGRYPVLSDTSSCSLQLRQAASERGIQLYDSSEFIDRFLLNRLEIEPVLSPVAAHLTCSAQKLGINSSFQRVLDRLTPNWTKPDDIHCCGFAGDKGYTQPEVSASALKGLAVQVADCEFGVSTNRSCEVGLSSHSGLTYYSLFEVLDKHSTALKP